MKTWQVCGISLVIMGAAGPALAQSVRYVDDDAPAGGSGLAWTSAYKHLQDALGAAAADPAITEIRVARGTYRPDRTAASPSGTRDRLATFQLRNALAVLGGYAGLGSANPNARTVAAPMTILSGDLASNDGLNFLNAGENSYHVATATGLVRESGVLEGFVISGGNANGAGAHATGGGMYNFAKPTLGYLSFVSNRATGVGGGVYNRGNSTVANCAFIGNVASGGGGFYADGLDPTLVNCLFSGNRAVGVPVGPGGRGAGLSAWNNANIRLMNCTLWGNVGLAPGAGVCFDSSEGLVTNCVAWGNTPDQFSIGTNTVEVTYSNVQGGMGGMGNINVAPLFMDADGLDNIPGTPDDNLIPRTGSPLIEAGTNSANVTSFLDLAGAPRVVDGDADGTLTIDIGAYEYQRPAPPAPCNIDFNRDGIVNAQDLLAFLAAYAAGCP